jgi:hypothetical protein
MQVIKNPILPVGLCMLIKISYFYTLALIHCKKINVCTGLFEMAAVRAQYSKDS